MKVATWNVNGIRARQQQFAEWVEAEQPDIIGLQEIKPRRAGDCNLHLKYSRLIAEIPDLCGRCRAKKSWLYTLVISFD